MTENTHGGKGRGQGRHKEGKTSVNLRLTDDAVNAIYKFKLGFLKANEANNALSSVIVNALSVGICKICGGNTKPSKALINPLCARSEWSDGDMLGATLSASSDAKITGCLKCEECGHSFKI
jgi:hypothetical protein